MTPILVCDVWEHAYYLDHKQDRKASWKAWFDQLANWDFAGQQYAAATSGGQGWRYPARQVVLERPQAPDVDDTSGI